MKIYDAVMDENSDVNGTVVVLDIADSTKMKETMDQMAWLGNYAKAFDLVVSSLTPSAEIVKYIGDGIMIFFPVDCHTDAINSAILMQETLLSAAEDNKITCALSTGIASGQVKRIPVNEGKYDYLGVVVDRAFRLCSAAVPRAIFVDADTVISANIGRVKSVVGKALRREATEYVGDSAKIQLKGFSKLVPFHEIYWSKDRYGIRPSNEQRLTNTVVHGTQPPEVARAKVPTEINKVVHGDTNRFSLYGEFSGWRGPKVNLGSIHADDGKEYFCHKGAVAAGFDLSEKQWVFFVPQPSGKELENATAIVPIGAALKGTIVSVVGQNGFIEVPLLSHDGHENIYGWLEDITGVSIGDQCSFELGGRHNTKKKRYTMRAEKLEVFE